MSDKDLERKKADLLRMLAEEPAHDREKFAEKMKEGITHQWAQLQDDGSIALDISQWLPDGTYGHGNSVTTRDDPEYEELRSLHRLMKPGDASTVVKKWIDGQWVIQPDDADSNKRATA